MVIKFDAHAAVTPAGKFTGVPIPVAPVVVCVIGVRAVLIHNVGVDDAALTVLFGVTVIVPVALTVPHPPVNGIL
jgi:phosphatidylserine synthase